MAELRGPAEGAGEHGTEAGARRPRVAFYCVSSSEYFLGAVGLVNSLRLVGHTEPIHLLDCGLSPEQRRTIAGEVELTPAPSDLPPFMLKTVAPLRHPADVMVLIDADMIVTRRLDGAIDDAASGRLVVPRLEMERFVARWGELGLGEARRHPYVTSGLIVAGGTIAEEVVRLIDELGRGVELERTFLATGDPGYHFHYADQDILNAIISTRLGRRDVVALDSRLVATTPFEGLEVIDEKSLRCAYRDGTEPLVVHHVLGSKPWLEPAWEGVYSRLLRRALAGPGLAVSAPKSMLPLRMRTGPLAELERRRVHARLRLRSHLGGSLSSRLRALRARVADRGS